LINISHFILLIWFIRQVIFANYLILYNNNNFMVWTIKSNMFMPLTLKTVLWIRIWETSYFRTSPNTSLFRSLKNGRLCWCSILKEWSAPFIRITLPLCLFPTSLSNLFLLLFHIQKKFSRIIECLIRL
jgi:hypothetical protein